MAIQVSQLLPITQVQEAKQNTRASIIRTWASWCCCNDLKTSENHWTPKQSRCVLPNPILSSHLGLEVSRDVLCESRQISKNDAVYSCLIYSYPV